MSNNTFSSIEAEELTNVNGGGETPCPDAADIYAQRAAVGVVDGAIRVGNAVDAAGRGDVFGFIGNTAGAVIDAAAVAKDLVTPPSTPLSCPA
jgi:hypothetical protein